MGIVDESNETHLVKFLLVPLVVDYVFLLREPLELVYSLCTVNQEKKNVGEVGWVITTDWHSVSMSQLFESKNKKLEAVERSKHI